MTVDKERHWPWGRHFLAAGCWGPIIFVNEVYINRLEGVVPMFNTGVVLRQWFQKYPKLGEDSPLLGIFFGGWLKHHLESSAFLVSSTR